MKDTLGHSSTASCLKFRTFKWLERDKESSCSVDNIEGQDVRGDEC